MRGPVLAAVLAAAAAASAGCSSGAELASSSGPNYYSCEDITVPGHTLTDGRWATELSAAGLRTVLQTQGVTRKNLATWRIVEDSAARVTIIRELVTPEKQGDRVVASHQYVDRKPAAKPVARAVRTSAIPLPCALQELVPVTAPAAETETTKALPEPKA